MAGDYFKVKADYAPYYKNALLYLACVDLDRELSDEDIKARAHDLCIAALLGETIYNFGELVRGLDCLCDGKVDEVAATSDTANTGRHGTRVDQRPDQRVQCWGDWQI